MNLTNIAVIESIVEQHAEEEAFLWLLRDAAVQAPHYSLKDLARHR
jgi:RecJ-like exonuclease